MKNADMPASPAYHEGAAVTLGLTKRELFAAMAMQGILANPGRLPYAEIEGGPNAYEAMVANFSAGMADALLAALEPKP